jgi:hypothetical protein
MSETKNPRFNRALQRMQETHDAKSHDYATDANPYANFDFAQTVAARFQAPHDHVFATMVGIKLARLGELLGRGKTPKPESIDDSFLDLANYVVLWWTSYQRDRELAHDAVGDEGVGIVPPKPSPVRAPTPPWFESPIALLAKFAADHDRGYVSDGAGQEWLTCGPSCDLRMTRPGQVTCRCHGHSDDSI